MQVVFESMFDIVYLISVVILGIIMIKKSNGNAQFKLFGIMAVVLGCGDAFHLVPRVYAMWTTGMEANAAALGFGQFITSITMTLFYCILYNIYVKRYNIKDDKMMRTIIYGLAAIRIILCLMPQNEWLNYDAPLLWGILRNIPFAIMGLIIIVLFYKQAKLHHDQYFKYMWLAIVLSFGFYIPVVLFAKTYPLIGMLMIPKTCAYVWVVLMGYKQLKQS